MCSFSWSFGHSLYRAILLRHPIGPLQKLVRTGCNPLGLVKLNAETMITMKRSPICPRMSMAIVMPMMSKLKDPDYLIVKKSRSFSIFYISLFH